MISRIGLGDRAAFDQLYQLCSAKLFGTLMRLLKNRALAEDSLQDVFIKIWHKADRYVPQHGRGMAWLMTLTRHHAIDVLRRQRPTTHIDDVAHQMMDGAPDPHKAVQISDSRAALEKCLDELEAQKAEAVRAAYIEGYTYEELASRYEIPLNTMRTWLRRSLKKLKDCLQS